MSKRITVAFGVAALLIGFAALPARAFAYTGTGDGTALNPFLISTCGQLQEVNNNLSAAYKLMEDVDCAALSATPGFTPLGTPSVNGFTGVFDGNDHYIQNLTINLPTTNNTALFTLVKGGTVKNVKLVAPIITGRDYTAALFGRVQLSSTISRVSVFSGQIIGRTDVGGIAGSASNSTVDKSYTRDTAVSGHISSGTINEIGGLFGTTSTATITKVFSEGNVVGNDTALVQSNYIGGIVGHDFGNTTLTDAYSSANVSGGVDVGGIAGSFQTNSTMLRAYSSGALTAVTVDLGGLAGQLLGGTISYSFSTSSLTMSVPSNIGGVVGLTDGINLGTIDHTYWDRYKAGTAVCIGDAHISVSSCTSVNASNATPTIFTNESTSPPLNSFNFADVWKTRTDDYPTLRFASGGDLVTHAVRDAHHITVSWETTETTHKPYALELRYRLASDPGNWIYVSINDPAVTSYIISNLTPETSYVIDLHYIDDLGAAGWQGFITETAAEVPVVATTTPTTKIAAATTSAAVTSTPSPTPTASPIVNHVFKEVQPATTQTAAKTAASEKRSFPVEYLFAPLVLPLGLLINKFLAATLAPAAVAASKKK